MEISEKIIRQVVAEFDLELIRYEDKLYVKSRQGKLNDTLRAFIRRYREHFMLLASEQQPPSNVRKNEQ